jgi:hypothetical protein
MKDIEVADWRAVAAEIESNIDRIWLEEPAELRRVVAGVIESGAGSGQQVFSVLVHLEAYLMIVSQDIIFRFQKTSLHENIELEQMVTTTREFLFGTFHIFEFMEDLGLAGMHELGEKYNKALSLVSTKEEYRDLTGSMHTYIIKLHQWIHLMFPWKLGVAFPHRSAAEVKSLAGIL